MLNNAIKGSHSFLVCAIFVLFLSVQATASPSPDAADTVWASLRPTIELFWKERQDSPHQAQQDAWEIISSLKDFIHAHPESSHVAEAYYILGEAYSAVFYFPEAIAHWRIVTRDFPSSPWASEALTAIVLNLEKRGESGRLKGFYKEIIKNYPDTPAAKAAWVSLAIDALSRGQKELVSKYVSELEASDPNIHVTVPRFLDLKARLLSEMGREREAREKWLQYLNLTHNREEKAAALFRIAESFRRQGRLQNARKYYSILKLDYRTIPEAYFARFRLFQMGRKYKALRTTGSQGRQASSRIFLKEIIKKYPTHPISQEVEYEVIKERMQQARYVEALRECSSFLKRMPESPYATRVMELALSAGQALSASNYTLTGLQGQLKDLKGVEESTSNSRLREICSKAREELWNRLIRRLAAKGEHEKVLIEIWQFKKEFASSSYGAKLAELGRASLLNLDRKFMNENDPLALLNFHYEYKDQIVHSVASPEHFLHVGRAWNSAFCPEAAQRAYYQGLLQAPEQPIREKLLFELADTATKAREIRGAEGALALLSDKGLESPEVRYLKALTDYSRGRYEMSLDEATAGLASARKDKDLKKKFQNLLLDNMVKLGKWEQVIDTVLKWEDGLTKDEAASLFRKIGDEAFRLGYSENAYQAYRHLFSLEPGEETASMRMALAAFDSGRPDSGVLQLQALTQADDPLLKKAAARLLDNKRFWDGPASRYKPEAGRQP